jgi:hypothetical protein
MNRMIIVLLLLLNLYVKMGIYEHDVFLCEIDDKWSCGCEIANEFMFKCCWCYLDICCCWIDAMGTIEMMNYWWICCCCWKLWKFWWNGELSLIVVSMIFNEWNKLILMSYGIMIFCFWLLFGNEEWFWRKLGFWVKVIVSVFGK